jgi:hypothetical protein
MMSLSKWFGAMAVLVFLASSVGASEAVSGGKVKFVNAEKKEFVLTDYNGKDWTLKFGNDVVINRGGKESATGLNAGDAVNVCYDKGVLTWTARYILVQDGDAKNWELMLGTVKNYNGDKNQLAFSDTDGKDHTFAMGDARTRLNGKDSKIDGVKIGDHFLAIVDRTGNKTTLKTLMIERK